MTSLLSPDAEKYRELLEARARIHYATSELWLRVSSPTPGQWLAELQAVPNGKDALSAAELAATRGTGETAERALEELAEQLDALERDPAG
jgi:hypothetical protein